MAGSWFAQTVTAALKTETRIMNLFRFNVWLSMVGGGICVFGYAQLHVDRAVVICGVVLFGVGAVQLRPMFQAVRRVNRLERRILRARAKG